MAREQTYFLPYQAGWIKDQAPLKICEKGRQIGLSYADSYDSVKKVAPKDARLPVFVGSRDMVQAKQYLLYCKRWARILNHAAEDLGEVLFDKDKDLTAFELKFANGLSIYSLSSSPDAFAGKTGHIKLDEFALHREQRELYRIAKPATQWGGQISVISTHRGTGTVFNEIIRDIKEKDNPMQWSLHTIPIQRAVADGIVERINLVSNREETRDQFIARLRRECIDEEQWLQEYCCVPADDAAAFITYELIAAAEVDNCYRDYGYLLDAKNPLYVGVDVARKQHLAVIDVEEKVGDVSWERMRIEMLNTKFSEMEDELYRVLALPQVKRCCIDATGLGMQLAERARDKFSWKVEAITFTGPVKEELAYPVRSAFEDRAVRIPRDAALRADIRGIRKETTISGNIRFVGESEDSHCDRFWAKALALHAAKEPSITPAAYVVET
jgi:phage FluMu gp28-like protein